MFCVGFQLQLTEKGIAILEKHFILDATKPLLSILWIEIFHPFQGLANPYPVSCWFHPRRLSTVLPRLYSKLINCLRSPSYIIGKCFEALAVIFLLII